MGYIGLSSRNLSALQENLGKATVKFEELFNVLSKITLSPEIERKKLEIAKALLEAGADVNAEATLGYTPLHAAIVRSSGDIVELLISAL